MRIMIENLKQQTGPEGPYYSFWVRLWVPGSPLWDASSGWRYFPGKRTLATPSVNKSGRFFNTHKVSPELYNAIAEEVERLLGLEPVEEMRKAA